MANERTYTGGRFLVDINGDHAGYIKKISGGGMTADIASNDLGPDNVQKKHVANIKWEPFKLSIGIGMGNEIYQWIKAAFQKGYVTKNGSITSGDFNYKAQSVQEFYDALITEVTVPKLSGDAKEAAYFDIGFEAERVRWSKGGGEDLKGKVGPAQKAWLCSNFRFKMGDLPCDRTASIDSFTWKCAVASDQVGIFHEATKHPAKVTVPDLKFSISMADYQPWADAAKSWFVDGNHEESNEMDGSIEFLGPDMKKPIGSIQLFNCGFKSFKQDDAEANSEKIKRFNVEMYIERMEFNIDYFDAAK